MLDELNAKNFANIDAFITSRHVDVGIRKDCLPAVYAFAGVNVADHDDTFDRMATFLRTGRHVAVLHAKDCGTVLAACKAITSQLCREGVMDDDDEGEDEEDVMDVAGLKTCQPMCRYDFEYLTAWYHKGMLVYCVCNW